MGKRIVAIFSTILALLVLCACRVFVFALGDHTLAETAAQQQTYTLTIPSGRGNFYDRNGKALTGGKTTYMAAIAPGPQAAAALQRVLSAERMAQVQELLEAGQPFLLSLDEPVEAEGIVCVPQTERTSRPALAVHLLGYLDGGGNGVTGLEKAYDSFLQRNGGKTEITYTVDALGHLLPGSTAAVHAEDARGTAKVQLTLDQSIQSIVENALHTHIQKGAAVVLEAGSAQILAMASVPTYDPTNVAASLNAADGPLVDRVLQAYNVGSVFKLVSAATALEAGVDPETTYRCTGTQQLDARTFHCYEGEAHGMISMRQAIAQSCNCYFVNLSQTLSASAFLQKARLCGFGTETPLAPSFSGSAGTLPTLKSLQNGQELASFSFGQGALTATPLQVAAMVNAVASKGFYTPPSVILGTQARADAAFKSTNSPDTIPVMSENTAALLTSYMVDCVQSGTGMPGKPSSVSAAAKTATAQTGRMEGGVEENICWYTGFFPVNAPRYVVVVMEEGGTSGGKDCGPVFREIAEKLSTQID